MQTFRPIGKDHSRLDNKLLLNFISPKLNNSVMNNTELIRRTEILLDELDIDTSDIKQVCTFEKLTKLWLALQRAAKKDPPA